jgi:nucleoside phosphorylase
MKMALFAALPQEYRRFQRLSGGWVCVRRRPPALFQRLQGQDEWLLAVTGMGAKLLARALDLVLAGAPLQGIVSMGFAGSLWEQFAVGQVVLAEHILHDAERAAVGRFQPLSAAHGAELLSFCAARGVKLARVVTCARPGDKEELARRYGAQPAVVDMESYYLAHSAVARGIPFVALRAVSDGLHDRIPFPLESIADAHGRVLLAKVVAAALHRPSLVPVFAGLGRRAGRAARRLAAVVAALLALSPEELTHMMVESRLGYAPDPVGGPQGSGENP